MGIIARNKLLKEFSQALRHCELLLLQYIQENMYMARALYIIWWFGAKIFYPYPSGSLQFTRASILFLSASEATFNIYATLITWLR